MMKRYYLSVFFGILIGVNSIGAGDLHEEHNTLETFKDEVDSCQTVALDKNDKLKLLIEGYKDEEFIKIILYTKLLEKNSSSYLCEIDKIIERCLKRNDQRFTINNFIRLIKATVFGGGAILSARICLDAWNEYYQNIPLQTKHSWAILVGFFGTLSGLHSLVELQKICNNYDQNQLHYKAIVMKAALLEYQKK